MNKRICRRRKSIY